MRSLLIAVMMAFGIQSASADPVLVRAYPEPDSVATIIQIELEFDEILRASGSSILIVDEGGEPVDGVNIFGGRILFFRMDFPPLPGLYEIRWRAASVSGHRAEGKYRVTLVAVP